MPVTSSAATSGMIVICSARSHSVPTGSATASTGAISVPPASAQPSASPPASAAKVQPVGRFSGREISALPGVVIMPLEG